MPAAHFPMYAVVAQQTERIRGISVTQVKELIAESDSKVDSIQNGIVALESRVAALVELRDRERANGDALRYLAAPISTVPVELLAEIFLLTIREFDVPSEARYDWDSSEVYGLHIQDAYRVSHVCRRWKQVANGTPRLWTGPVKVQYLNDLDEFHTNGLRMWLPRSAPLSIPITIAGLRKGSCSTESGSRLTEILLCIAARWRSLRFVDYMVPASFVQRLAGSRLDSLEEVVLSSVDRDSFDSDFDPTTILSFATAPRLRKITFDSSCGIPMPWVQLTHITLENFLSPKTFWNIFSRCTNVVQASIYIEWSELSPHTVALNQLRILSVNWIGPRGMLFFHCLSAPLLDELYMYFEEAGETNWDEATFTAFQLRSPNITKLKLDGDGLSVPSQSLITALRHTASLTHFSINDCPDSADELFFQALCYTEDAEPLVPCLHTLAVAEGIGRFSQDGLANMIGSRWWTDAELALRSRAPAVARLRRIRLKDSPFIGYSPVFRETMNALQEAGLDVVFAQNFWRLGW